jgi:hypothetical protein
VGLLAALLVTQLVALANSIITLRCEIEDLQTERAYLETSNALRMAQWVRMTGKETIMRRAERELGLIPPDGPGPVIVMKDEATERSKSAWQWFLDAVGGGINQVQTVSAQDSWP